MKKYISILFMTLSLLLCFPILVSADTTCSLSEDLQTMILDDKPYTRINSNHLNLDYTEYLEKEFTFTPAQEETIEKIELIGYESRTVIHLDIYYYDGSTLSIDFLQDDYMDTYNSILENQSESYIIDFEYPTGNTVTAKKADLYGKDVILNHSDLDWCDYFYTSIQSSDGRINAIVGALLIVDDNFFYVDFEEIHQENWYDFYPLEMSQLPAHKISNAELILELMDAEEKYYADDFGFLYNDDLSITISKVFATFLFIIIPLGVFITFLILGIRSKTYYKKLFMTICALSGAELLATILFILIL